MFLKIKLVKLPSKEITKLRWHHFHGVYKAVLSIGPQGEGELRQNLCSPGQLNFLQMTSPLNGQVKPKWGSLIPLLIAQG